MKDIECVQFLQWALPQLQMRWQGFRKVRHQVCKRIARRIEELALPSLQAYRQHLRNNREEWRILDGLSRVTISRFYRDKRVFGLLEAQFLPALAQQVLEQGGNRLRIWSAGCASGEEPYTLSLLWAFALSSRFPDLRLHILATDADPDLLARANKACYNFGSVKNLPETWRDRAFLQTDDHYCLHRPFARPVEFRQQDIRDVIPDGPFHLVLCRNLVFTYFESGFQQVFLHRLERALHPAGVLLLGVHESLPESGHGFAASSARWGFYELQPSKTV
ncbi:MAG: CheR family methyltransferase [Pseudomonadota bacterium]